MSEYINLDYDSPFQPSTPVNPVFFEGREEIIKKILRYFPKIIKNNTQHFFLTGNKGMGKTSVAEFVINEVKEYNMNHIYISNKDNNSVEVLASRIIQELINQYPPQSRKEKIKTWFGEHVSEIDIKGTKIKFDIDKRQQEEVKEHFLDYVAIAIEDLKELYEGIFIIIDDINGLSGSKEFVDWYKRISDTMAVNKRYHLPIYFILEGYPEKFDDLVELDRSFGRIFHYANLEELTGTEIKEFYENVFESVNFEVTDYALELMIDYSSGIPLTMQYIGDSVFWNTDNSRISQKNAEEGIILAGYEIGNKQLRRNLKRMNNPLYNDMLIKISKNQLINFDKSSLKNILTSDEYEHLKEFLDKMEEYDILESIDYTEETTYNFKDKLAYSYFRIKSFEKTYSKNTNNQIYYDSQHIF